MTADRILDTLRQAGPVRAIVLRQQLGMSHEALYEALVALEAQHLVRVNAPMGRGTAPQKTWEAMS